MMSLLLIKFALDFHELAVCKVEALGDGCEICQLVFMVDKAETLTHFVLLCQINADQLGVIQVQPVDGCIQLA